MNGMFFRASALTAVNSIAGTRGGARVGTLGTSSIRQQPCELTVINASAETERHYADGTRQSTGRSRQPMLRGNMPETLHVVCPHCDAVNRVPRERLRAGAKCGACHRPLFEGRPLPLTDPNRFAKHAEKNDIPLLIDFWAAWCGPCRTMAPIFEQAASRLEPDLRLVKLDSDAAPELAARYSIRSIPTLLLVRHGREIARTAGVMSLPQLIGWARDHAERAMA